MEQDSEGRRARLVSLEQRQVAQLGGERRETSIELRDASSMLAIVSVSLDFRFDERRAEIRTTRVDGSVGRPVRAITAVMLFAIASVSLNVWVRMNMGAWCEERRASKAKNRLGYTLIVIFRTNRC